MSCNNLVLKEQTHTTTKARRSLVCVSDGSVVHRLYVSAFAVGWVLLVSGNVDSQFGLTQIQTAVTR